MMFYLSKCKILLSRIIVNNSKLISNKSTICAESNCTFNHLQAFILFLVNNALILKKVKVLYIIKQTLKGLNVVNQLVVPTGLISSN